MKLNMIDIKVMPNDKHQSSYTVLSIFILLLPHKLNAHKLLRLTLLCLSLWLLIKNFMLLK